MHPKGCKTLRLPDSKGLLLMAAKFQVRIDNPPDQSIPQPSNSKTSNFEWRMVSWDVGTMSLEGAHFVYAVLATQLARF